MKSVHKLMLGVMAVATLGTGSPVKKPTAPPVDLETMVPFAEGTFRMGIEATEVARPYGDPWFFDQKPARDVTLGAYYLDRYEVTVAEFASFLTHSAGAYHHHPEQPIDEVAGGYLPREGFADHPINYVTWEAAHHYCRWAGKRLPTEAEWERAAAGLERRIFPWGDQGADCVRANHFARGSFCERGPSPVGSHPTGATPEGVHDMGGNLAEWVADLYALYSPEPAEDPRGPEEGWYRAVRGGSHLEGGITLRAHSRRHARPDRRASSIGFRCAYDISISDPSLRGSLEPLGEQAREPSERFPAPAAPTPEVVVGGLEEPVDLLAAGGYHFVLELGADRISRVDAAAQMAEPWAEELDDPRHLAAGDALFVTEATALSRVALDTGALAIVAPLLDPTHVVVDDSTAYVATASGIVSVAGGITKQLSDATGIEALALGPDALLYASGPDGDGTIGKITLSTALDETLVDAVSLEADSYPSALAVTGTTLHFVQREDGFPNGGLACRVALSGGAIDCSSHSPIHAERLITDGDRRFWAGRHVIAQAEAAGAYRVAVSFTRAGGLLLDQGRLWYCDRSDGRVYRMP